MGKRPSGCWKPNQPLDDIVIGYNDFVFSLWVSFPAEQEELFRPAVERILNSVELK